MRFDVVPEVLQILDYLRLAVEQGPNIKTPPNQRRLTVFTLGGARLPQFLCSMCATWTQKLVRGP